MKKKKRKIKIKLKSVIIFLVLIILVALIVCWYLNLKVSNIYVIGNSILKENDILNSTNLLNYPKLKDVNEEKIKKDLLNNPLINKVIVKKTINGKVTIEIEENTPLLKMSDNLFILSNGEMEEIDYIGQIPYLKGEVDSAIFDNFVKKMLLIDKDILIKISEVMYAKTDLDNERFLMYMNDGNEVYITLSKIELINSYNDIYPTLDKKKGILYLDSGNHFEIKTKDTKVE